MPTVTQSLVSFLTKRKTTHNGPDLLERFLAYGPYMEVQINVAADNGFPVPNKRNTFSDGLEEWWSIRIPKNAATEPEFRDYEMRWPLDLHADSIGSTGWDYARRTSRWVGFDFDSITGHAAGVGIKDEALDAVRSAACALPYVEVRKSSGGAGLHLYVCFDKAGIPTENHTVHAALGRAVLGMMASEVGFDFASHIDACGGNMWLWSRKATPENQGFALIKPAERVLTIADMPSNWRDHVEVIARKRTKIKVNNVEEGQQDAFEALASSRQIIPLDTKHKAIIDELRASGFSTIWVSDHHLLQTHTAALQFLMTEKKDELDLIGFYKTISAGKDKGTCNCFAFPLANGGWKVYRFSPGVAEAETWEQDGQGWTTCFFNHQPSLKVAARASGGVEDPEKGGFVFTSASPAADAARALGQELNLPAAVMERETRLKAHKDGRLIVQIKKGDNDEGMTKLGWLAKKDYWLQVFETKAENKSTDLSMTEFDSQVRALTSPLNEGAGWMMKNRSGVWVRRTKDDLRSKLLALDYDKPTAEKILGKAVDDDWKLVTRPFEPEYPGDRQWNLNAPQWKFQPAELDDDEVPHHPTWDSVFQHCGQDLDEPIRDLEWAQRANIRSGAQYLLTWAALMLREPLSRLPYLFFVGEQKSGKSTFHKALALLLNGGVASGDRALASEFNGELANCVLGYIEETDLSTAKGAYNKLKDWVTNDEIWIRRMRTDAYKQINFIHFVQTANDRSYCPIQFGDTRIVVIFVPMLDPGMELSMDVLVQRLIDEAPHLMRTIVDLTLPPKIERLRLPLVNTSTKERAEATARTPLEAFIADCCFEVRGEMILFKEFRDRFEKWLEEEHPSEKSEWSSIQKIVKQLPHRFPYGKYTGNLRHIGNISWESPSNPNPNAKLLTLQNGRLVFKKD